MVVLGGFGCTGKLALNFGETLCDRSHGCPDATECVSGVCVQTLASGPGRGDNGSVESLGDVDFPPNIFGDIDACRVDAQCGTGRLCVAGRCLDDPCTTVTPPLGEVCSYRCRPLATACDTVLCVDNREHCLGGACVSLCTLDPCSEGGCVPGSANCDANRLCTNNTFCSLGRCEPSVVFNCDANLCPPGNECVIETGPPQPCSPNPCHAGWACQDLGGDNYTCVEIACSGVNCPPGETCVPQAGVPSCIDLCANLPCDQGGQLGCNANAVCCDRMCCPDDFLCRQGQCEPPTVTCSPACEDDETCLPTGCFCGPYNQLQGCGASQCCIADACDNPCNPNPCATEPTDRGCQRNCDLTASYECTNLCTGVTCTAPDTCDFSTGQCSCGGSSCSSNECCIADACATPCKPDPCDGSIAALTGLCVVSCAQGGPYFECQDQCAGASCPLHRPDCDPVTGSCGCGATFDRCNNSECCLPGGAASTCANPCPGLGAGTNPCYPISCIRDCAAVDGRRCVDPCGPGACASDVKNPDCDAQTGNCLCGSAPCGGVNNCCVAGSCSDPCGAGSVGEGDCAGQGLACIRDCTLSTGYRCEDQCIGVTCTDQNPVCDATTGTCQCNDGTSCAGVECCNGSTCVDPCVATPCPGSGPPTWYGCAPDCTAIDDRVCFDLCAAVTCLPNALCDPTTGFCLCSGAQCPNNGSNCCVGSGPFTCDADPCSPDPCAPSLLRCNRDCAQIDGYLCDDACAGVTCANPQREPDCDPRSGTCLCGAAPGGVQCNGGSRCCLAGACERPCTPNLCGPGNPDGFPGSFYRCVRDCPNSNGNGYRCEDWCATSSGCSQPNPDCDPTGQNQCNCGGNVGDPVCGGSQCCAGGTCIDPCTPGPCGGSGACVVDCADPSKYRCVDQCVPNPCSQPNPNCDSVTGACSCNGGNCGGGQCCLNGSCSDPCTGNPCGGSGACVIDCAQSSGYRCVDQCVPDPCTLRNPDCNSATGACTCNGTTCGGSQCCNATSCNSPCSPDPCGDTGQCVIDCSQPSDYRCDDQCGSASCNQPNPDCYPPTGNCGCGLAAPTSDCSGSECCLTGSCSDPCASTPCATAPDLRCTRDCAQGSGYVCDDACVGVTCSDLIGNPYCHSGTGACGCGAPGSFGTCSSGQACCGATAAGSVCQTRACDPANPGATCLPGWLCDACTGCFDPSGG